MKKIKSKGLVVVAVILLLVMCIGYAAITSQLTITGTGNVIKAKWDVHFANVVETPGSATPTAAATIDTSDATKLTYTAALVNPGDFYEFTVDVKNDGTLDAMLDSININSLNSAQAKYLDYEVTYADGRTITQYDKLEKETQETIKVSLCYKKDITVDDLPEANDSITLTVAMNYVQADENAKERIQTPVVTNADIGKYVDLGKDVIGDAATTDDWRVLWVDETNNLTYLILADYLPASKMPSATGITNNGSYNVYANDNRDQLLNYMTTSTNWSSLIDSSIQGATVTGSPIEEVVEASYTAKYGGEWSLGTAQADTLLVPHNDVWNLCSGCWLASPFTGDSTRLWGVYYNGDIYRNAYNYTDCGLRPVVCLSSDTKLDVVEESDPEDPPEDTGVTVTNVDIGKYVDLGKDVIGTTATTDDWRVLWVDETNSQTYLILADYLPASKMPSATGITNNGSYNVYSTSNRITLLNYITTSSNWSSLIDSSIQGATVTGSPTEEVVEASYTAKYGGEWSLGTAQADTLLVPHNDVWNSCSGCWLASPSAGDSTRLWGVYYNGDIYRNAYNYTDCGLRPVVCLSSDIPLNIVDE